MRKFWALIMLLPALACAKVSVYPLQPDGKPLANATEGVRYYEPHPYLLVAHVPSDATTSTTGDHQGGGAGRAAPAPNSAKPNPSPTPTANPPPATPAGGGSDTSFLASNSQYTLRLVYLPDYSRPYAISESPGLFGTASMKPQLQDGWMLTGLEASGDSKTAETLTAIAQLAGAAITGGAATAAKPPTPSAARVAQPVPNDVLPPGLYKLEFNKLGGLAGLVRVTSFCRQAGNYSSAELLAALTNASILPDKCPLSPNVDGVDSADQAPSYTCESCPAGPAGASCRRACGTNPKP